MFSNRKLFLSAVSREFLAYRELLTQDLKRPTLEVAVQEDFIVTGGSTLVKLDDYIRACDGVIHLIGKATGAAPEEPAVAALKSKLADKLPWLEPHLDKPQPGFSYTQWEACLALYHKRPLFIYLPADFALDANTVPRDPRFVFSAAEMQAQKDHHQRICALGHDRGEFLNEERLSSKVLRDLVEILPRLESTLDVPPTKLRHSAERLIGRDEELARLDAAWNDPHKNVVIVRALGGMGKTSLVATWMAELASKNWRGAARVFDWTFYDQGTSDERATSADLFIAAALAAFGDPDPTQGSAWTRGERLAGLVGKVRCLLVLDGLEPLQYPPGQMQGKLKDAAIEALLKGLAANNKGLCVVTTREKLPDIQQYYGRTADDIELVALTDLAGAALLHHHGATTAGAHAIEPDDLELQAASREVRGHGLTLQLLGQYLRLAENGDIRKRDTVRLADADREYQNDKTRPYGHAFKAMEAYEKWFLREGDKGERLLAVLRLLGLFDRPASKACLEALRKEPVIAGLTEPLVGMAPREWTIVVKRLEEINLLAVQSDGSLDAHPLLREYFGFRLRQEQLEVWQAAHRRLYEHLCEATKEGGEPTLQDLQPLYQAVAHGCLAGMHQEACEKVYFKRIQRGGKKHPTKKLGEFGSDLAAVACFFEQPWSKFLPGIPEDQQASLLNEAGTRLRALSRLPEALEPFRTALDMGKRQKDWTEAARRACNLSELERWLGSMSKAVQHAEESVTYADTSGDETQQVSNRATHADVLHHAGRRDEAKAVFKNAESRQAGREPKFPLLYSAQGFQYCVLLLAEVEREAARTGGGMMKQKLLDMCRTVSERAEWMERGRETSGSPLLDIALYHLALGCTELYTAILESRSRRGWWGFVWRLLRRSADSQRRLASAATELDDAVSSLHRAGQTHIVPLGLLARAWLRTLTGQRTGPDSAQSDLDEAWEIAVRGSMPLHQADIHLYRARLFFREAEYPWDKDPDGKPRGPEDDLTAAGELINTCGYHRRDEELADAKDALKHFRSGHTP